MVPDVLTSTVYAGVPTALVGEKLRSCVATSDLIATTYSLKPSKPLGGVFLYSEYGSITDKTNDFSGFHVGCLSVNNWLARK